MKVEKLRQFYKGKKVLLTGHTGFKGSWLCCLLHELGAELYGYALAPEEPSLFRMLEAEEQLLKESCIGDVRDYDKLAAFYRQAAPELVIHLAAQPLVRESYRIPRETYETNVMGTVNLLECIRLMPCASFLNVTTDKVYLNEELPGYAYKEEDKLDGYDPYSNSKSCSELVTHSYACSFLREQGVAVSTARAGNVIGGGDYALDRILPDAVRAVEAGNPLTVRNPGSVRPYQHVLEALLVYLIILMEQTEDPSLCGSYNVGPDSSGCITTGTLCDLFFRTYGEGTGWTAPGGITGPHEAGLLRLDNRKIKDCFQWKSIWNVEEAVEKTAVWYKRLAEGRESALSLTRGQIRAYLEAAAG